MIHAPSSRLLAFAIVIASVVVLTCVLPAEYGVDPTGLGRLLGLTPMGQFKRAVAEEVEAARDAQAAADSAAGVR